MSNNFYDLFLSYSRSSLKLANKIIYSLEKYGIIVWFDRTDVLLGCDIKSNLCQVIKRVSNWIGMIVLIDSEYLHKEWCKMELDYALKNKINILPIFYKVEKNDLPCEYSFLKKMNVVTIRKDSDIDYTINKLLDFIIFHPNDLKFRTIRHKLSPYLLTSYTEKSRTQNEKVICADNLALFLEIILGSSMSHYERVLVNIIHIKTIELYSIGEISFYDIKIICHATNMLLKIFTLIE